jgi:hypothetical protein
VLVNVQDSPKELVFLPPGPQRERRLSWMDWTPLSELSGDGRRVLVTSSHDGAFFTHIRPTDGSLPLKLGAGWALTLSPDGGWVLAVT